MVSARSLRHAVYVETPSAEVDAVGGLASTYTLASILVQPWWVKLEPLSGRELVAGRSIHADATHKVTGRWISGLTTAHRLRTRVGNRILNIREIKNVDERGRWAELVCVESV